ncbi:Fructose-bisphosphate aldolase, class-I [Carpediemonas membranifera]|uniref:fructose-bisphosphate aldolase n=1 Tax=Carpediemonas membranifera TaxID=201153 RepID=A0A8J6AXC0_9EUKA|nr:Fructose-bisphosphate aldolase, class-I [Carpediemonas membranifera]|eukprot:KAG9389599.1 Fructose-bisphosphate aldolase, class-I [Carpediemonas membranifera]
MMLEFGKELDNTVQIMTRNYRGLAALDESVGTMGKRFLAFDIDNTAENRRHWREILLTSSPEFTIAIGGVILFTEQLDQRADDGKTLPELIQELGMVTGVKTDLGQASIAGTDETVLQGLDKLHERCRTYHHKGARFSKFRAIFPVDEAKGYPSARAVYINAFTLARMASICQQCGLVPVVEPEILANGTHTIEQHANACTRVWTAVFDELKAQEVDLTRMILKTSMVAPGLDSTQHIIPADIAQMTLNTLMATVPAAVPAVCFLSGGFKEQESTGMLNAINLHAARLGKANAPWQLSFSFARALQGSAMKAWAGNPANEETAQQCFVKRCRANHLAAQGLYKGEDALDRETKAHVFAELIGRTFEADNVLPAEHEA